MTEKNFTKNKDTFAWKKVDASAVEYSNWDGINQSPPVRESRTRDGYGSRVSGQYLAGSGALVFEGELLEFPLWGNQAA